MITIKDGGHTLQVTEKPRLRLIRCGWLFPMWQCQCPMWTAVAESPWAAWDRWFSIAINAQALGRDFDGHYRHAQARLESDWTLAGTAPT